MEPSKKEKIEIVITHKQRIVETTNQIIEKLRKLESTSSKEQYRETSLFTAQKANQIISDLSIIGGFCGKAEKDYIRHLASVIDSPLTDPDYISAFLPIIEDWCTMVNSIIVDFEKTPFRFVGGEFQFSLRELKAKIKTVLKRQ